MCCVLLGPQPGVQRLADTPVGVKEQRTSGNGGYQPLREATIVHAMLDCIKSPPVDFADAVVEHFRLKREHIAKTILQWLAEVRTHVPLALPTCPATCVSTRSGCSDVIECVVVSSCRRVIVVTPVFPPPARPGNTPTHRVTWRNCLRPRGRC